jgi:hypothetical protein
MNKARRTGTARVALAVAATAWPVLWFCGPAAAKEGSAEVYVVNGLVGTAADVSVDGQVVGADTAPSGIVGPLELATGPHEIAVRPEGGQEVVRSVDVASGGNLDVVAHVPVDPAGAAVLTVYENDLSPVPSGQGRVAVAHTAAVPPADVRVNGTVAFRNIANGEVLTAEVPGGTYSVDIVPTGAGSPVVFGPVDLPVQAGTLLRVFAIGNPAAGTMNAVVQTFPVATSASPPPQRVPTGSGGQAALAVADGGPPAGRALVAVAGLLAGAALVTALVRRPR